MEPTAPISYYRRAKHPQGVLLGKAITFYHRLMCLIGAVGSNLFQPILTYKTTLMRLIKGG
ncbi:MAG: hypothetical protein Q4Q06_01760 [Bacteroidota bacterium]|nr:hypothetical protein [Bacteroidota bacterium]